MRTPQEIPLNSSARPLKGYLAHGFVDVFVHHYADFSGRTGRKAYWLAVATVFTAYLPLFCISWKVDPALAAGHAAYWLFLYCYGISSIAIIIPCIASTIRRLHDTGRSGWWYLVGLIPYAGHIILWTLLCLKRKDDVPEAEIIPRRTDALFVVVVAILSAMAIWLRPVTLE